MHAKALTLDAQVHVQPVLQSLRGLMRGLGALPGPKHIVLLSAGWPIDERDAPGELASMAADAAAANVVVHTFTAEQWALAAYRPRAPLIVAAAHDKSLLLGSVEMMSGLTGGQAARLVGSGDQAFRALAAGLSGYYRLGVRADPEDLDGKPRRIELKVSRPGATLSSYRRLIAGAKPTAAATSPVGALNEALRSASGLTDLTLRATSYVLHPESADTREMRVVLVGDVAQASAGPATAVAALFDLEGKPITAVEAAIEVPPTGPGAVTLSLRAPPAPYILRLAIRDVEGRLGSLERPVDARWKKTGDIQTPGLVVFRFAWAGGADAAFPRRHDRGVAGRAGADWRRARDSAAGGLRGERGGERGPAGAPDGADCQDHGRRDGGRGHHRRVDAPAGTLRADRHDPAGHCRAVHARLRRGGGRGNRGLVCRDVRGGCAHERHDIRRRIASRRAGAGQAAALLGSKRARAGLRRSDPRSPCSAPGCRERPRGRHPHQGRALADRRRRRSARRGAGRGAVRRWPWPVARGTPRRGGQRVSRHAPGGARLRAGAPLSRRLLRRRPEGQGGGERLADGAAPRARIAGAAAPGDRGVAQGRQARVCRRADHAGARALAGRSGLRAAAGPDRDCRRPGSRGGRAGHDAGTARRADAPGRARGALRWVAARRAHCRRRPRSRDR